MDDFKVFYDEEEDILYLAKQGEESEFVEISPGANILIKASLPKRLGSSTSMS